MKLLHFTTYSPCSVLLKQNGYNHTWRWAIVLPGISRAESSEEELDEITVDEEGEDEKGESLLLAETAFQWTTKSAYFP